MQFTAICKTLQSRSGPARLPLYLNIKISNGNSKNQHRRESNQINLLKFQAKTGEIGTRLNAIQLRRTIIFQCPQNPDGKSLSEKSLA